MRRSDSERSTPPVERAQPPDPIASLDMDWCRGRSPVPCRPKYRSSRWQRAPHPYPALVLDSRAPSPRGVLPARPGTPSGGTPCVEAGVASQPTFSKADGAPRQVRDPGVVVAEDSRARAILKRLDEMRRQLGSTEHRADD